MAKKEKEKSVDNKSNDNDMFADLAAGIGGEVLESTNSVRDWIDTGNLALNYLCSGKFVGGGVPSGKVVEIFGPSSSCKTLFAQNILKGCQKKGGICLFMDAENTLDKNFASKVSHLEASKVIVLKADTLQQAFGKLMVAIRKIREKYGNEKPIVIVYDSIAASPSNREYKETEMTEEQMAKAKDMPGEHAKAISKAMRQFAPLIESSNTTVIFINQTRMKVGVIFGSNETTSGGLALSYYTSLRLRTKAEKRFTDKFNNVIGMGVTVRNVKNKCFRPFIEARNMQLLFDNGINPFGGLLELLVQTERVESVGTGSFKVHANYSNGEEVKFRGTLEKNDVPLSVLLKCPKMVDAETAEQVQEYMDIFGSAVDAMADKVVNEEKVTAEDD